MTVRHKTQLSIEGVRRFLQSDEGRVAREKLASWVRGAAEENQALIEGGKDPTRRQVHEARLGDELADILALQGGASLLEERIPEAVVTWMRRHSGDVLRKPDVERFSRHDARFAGDAPGLKLFDALAKHVGTVSESTTDGAFYGALANIIRTGNSEGEGRSLTHWWQERWPRAADDVRLPLDDVLDVLQQPDKHPLRMGLLRWLRDVAGLGAEERPEVLGAGSPFEVRLPSFEDKPAVTPFRRQAREAAEAAGLARHADAYGAAGAVLTALASAADGEGRLDRKAARRLGPDAAKLFDLCAEALEGGKRTLRSPVPEVKYKGISPELMVRIARSAPRETFIERMPALADVSRRLGDPKLLEGWSMASVQHLFPSTLALYDELERNGLAKEKTQIIGKPYSTDEDVYARLLADGRDVDPSSRANGAGASKAFMEKALLEAAHAHLARLFEGVDPQAESEPRFLLLDEGGKLVKALHEDFPTYAHLCVAVEQTDRGLQVHDEAGYELEVPVMDVARSWLKKELEGPLIGESVVHSIEKELSALHEELRIEPKEATVIGYGAVGKNTADALRRRGYTVFVYDTDPERMRAAKADGCEVKLDGVEGPTRSPHDDEAHLASRNWALSKAQVLASCTGVKTLGADEYDLLPNQAVLVNAASGNHELGLDEVLASGGQGDSESLQTPTKTVGTFFRGKHVRVGVDEDLGRMHHQVVTSASGDRRLALRRGSVINMSEDIPPEYIQLTRGLLLTACLLAVRQQGAGLVALPDEEQRALRDTIQEHLRQVFGAAEGERFPDLAHPDFRGLEEWRL